MDVIRFTLLLDRQRDFDLFIGRVKEIKTNITRTYNTEVYIEQEKIFEVEL